MMFTFLGMAQNEIDGGEWNRMVDYNGQQMRLGDAVMHSHGLTPHK